MKPAKAGGFAVISYRIYIGVFEAAFLKGLSKNQRADECQDYFLFMDKKYLCRKLC